MSPAQATCTGLLTLAAAFALGACGGETTTTTTEVATTTATTSVETTTTRTTTAPEPREGPGGGADGARSCGDVPFEPQTDSGAFGITARGTDCGTARAVAAAAEGRAGGDYSARGFGCSGTAGGGELPSTEYVCMARRGSGHLLLFLNPRIGATAVERAT